MLTEHSSLKTNVTNSNKQRGLPVLLRVLEVYEEKLDVMANCTVWLVDPRPAVLASARAEAQRILG
jgi:hypothetical protein